MPTLEQIFRVYQDLAHCFDTQGNALMRNRFLVLAADAALTAGQTEEAELLRDRLLQYSPHHLLKPFASLVEALRSTKVQTYVDDLRRTYPPETAESLLASVRSEQDTAGKDQQDQVPPTLAAIEIPHTQETAPLADIDWGDGLCGGPDKPPSEPEPGPEGIKSFKVYQVLPPADDPAQGKAGVKPQPSPPQAAKLVGPPAALPGGGPKQGRGEPLARPTPPAPLKRRPLAPVRPEQTRSRAVPGSSPGEPPETDSLAGQWVSFGLFVVTFAAGVALAAYTLARPFLPPEWPR
jgi:hypothetical protein